MDISNASLLDESTAAAEAMYMCYNVHNGKRNKFFVSKHIFPQSIDVIKTRAHAINLELVIDDPANFDYSKADQYCGVIIQNPDNLGNLTDLKPISDKLKKSKTMLVSISDILSLCIVKPPGEMGADIAVGSAQRFGVPMASGGPHAGYMACKDEYKRKLPGRIIGVSIDAHGNQAYRMSLQTREQHIRRDKATSNICTAQALLANISAFFGMWHGPQGLKKKAVRVHFYSQILIEELSLLDYKFKTDPNAHFDTVTIDARASGFSSADYVLSQFHKEGINLRKVDDNLVQVAFNEVTTLTDLEELIEIFAFIKEKRLDHEYRVQFEGREYKELNGQLKRTSSYLELPQFTQLTSET